MVLLWKKGRLVLMNLYSLNSRVNVISRKPNKTVYDCLYLNELLWDAQQKGLTIEIDKKNKMYIISGRETKNVSE
jgi:hypothetical protein